MAAKQAPSKAEKNTKAPQKKPPSHKSTIEKTTRAQSSNPVQPLKQNKTHQATRAKPKNP
jgi:hypothetical protein